MKVALISPEWKLKNDYPPLGLAYIGAVLEKRDHNVRIFDLTLDDNKSFNEKMEDVIKFSPDIVGITAMSHNYEGAIETARYFKREIDEDVPIVLGGPHPTVMPDDVMKNEYVDFVVVGEGEHTFLELCENFYDKEFRGIEGLYYKDNGNIISQPRKHFIEDLDKLPFPARHLLRLDSYELTDNDGNKMVTIVSSRGCPYRCTYCYKGMFGRRYRYRSAENVVEEIKHCMDKFGYDSFYFIDDLFTMNTERVMKLTDIIKEEGLDIKWQCLARVNSVNLEMLKNMKDAGCYKVNFGIESGNQYILNRVKKAITLDQVRDAVKCCNKVGIETKGYFMIGLPGDTVSTMTDTLNFAKELKLDDLMFSIATPFPGTELWNDISSTSSDRDDANGIKSLNDAFYHSCDLDDVHIFYNLSEVTDDELMKIARQARKIEKDMNIKIFCKKTFGKRLGAAAWTVSKVSFLKKLGRHLLYTCNDQ